MTLVNGIRRKPPLSLGIVVAGPIIALGLLGVVFLGSPLRDLASVMIGIGISIVPTGWLYQRIIGDVADGLKSVLVPHFHSCYRTREDAFRQLLDYSQALTETRHHLMMVGLTLSALHDDDRKVKLLSALEDARDVDCFILHWESPAIALRENELETVDNTPTRSNLQLSWERFGALCDLVRKEGYPGRLRVFGYSAIPYFDAIGLDLDVDEKRYNARLLITHTLFQQHTITSPTFYLTRGSALFPAYQESVLSLRGAKVSVLRYTSEPTQGPGARDGA